jgi:hypothetical protein
VVAKAEFVGGAVKGVGGMLSGLVKDLIERWRAPGSQHAGGTSDSARYEILLDEIEPLDRWMLCTVCLNVDRSAAVARNRWRCADCGVDSSNETQQPLKAYLTTTPAETIEKNLREWMNVKGARVAYRTLRAARYKCLLTLQKRVLAQG